MTAGKSKGNIMVVDDTPANLRLLGNMLGERGYSVRPFPRGSLALRAAGNDPPDLILLDINMPEINGFELCGKLKEDPKLEEIPVIFISALTETMDKVKAFRAGGVDYITKPFQIEEVGARVETHLKIRRYQRELQVALDSLKAAQSQLVQSEKMAALGVLTAGIAHELNNPVNFMQASAQGLRHVVEDTRKILTGLDEIEAEPSEENIVRINQLKKELADEDLLTALNELVENIRLGASRTAEIVSGLRTFTRLDEAEKKVADLHENLDSTLVILRYRYKDSIEIEKDYGDVPPITCFPGKLNQVFVNILGNAIDAVESKGESDGEETISIKTSVERDGNGRCAAVRFTDSGKGISGDVIEHLFEPFFTTKEVGSGTGLGLSISYGIIQEHGGRIEVASEPGKGATFTVYIPLEEED